MNEYRVMIDHRGERFPYLSSTTNRDEAIEQLTAALEEFGEDPLVSVSVEVREVSVWAAVELTDKGRQG